MFGCIRNRELFSILRIRISNDDSNVKSLFRNSENNYYSVVSSENWNNCSRIYIFQNNHYFLQIIQIIFLPFQVAAILSLRMRGQ
jgi:hypothetical protein